MRSSASPAPPAYCRVCVLAPGRRVDVALPSDVPVAELVPMLLELLGEPAGPGRSGGRRLRPWRLTGAAGGALPPDATLDELGVLDGELLRLGPAEPPPAAPVFDDLADALAATAGAGIGDGRRGWTAAAGLATAVTGAVVLGGVRAGQAGGGAAVAAAVVAGVLGAGAALWRAAVLARRAGAPASGGSDPDGRAPDGRAPDGRAPDGRAPDGRAPEDPAPEDPAPGDPASGGRITDGRTTDGPTPARVGPDAAADGRAVVVACCAVPLAAGAGWAVLPGPAHAAHLLLAAAAAGVVAAAGQVVLRIVAPALIGGVVTAALISAAALLRLRFGVAPGALAAGTAALALAAGPMLPRAALSLAGVPRPLVTADGAELVSTDAGSDRLSAAELAERADLARGYLAGTSGGCAVVAACAGLVAAATAGASGIALAAVTAVVLALRARGLADPVPARLHLAVGIAAGVALTLLAAAWSGPTGRLVAALVLLAAAGVATAGPARVASPVARRAVDLLEGLLMAAAIPAALAAMGLFGLVRGL